MNRQSTTTLAASSSFSGKGIASSYRRLAITPNIPKSEAYTASSPKSSGLYSLVKSGEARIVRPWLNAVPPARIETLLANLFLGRIFFIYSFNVLLLVKLHYLEFFPEQFYQDPGVWPKKKRG
jgi:hypothetical protein